MLEIRPLSRTLEEAAKKNINEDPARREEDVTTIKEWISQQPHLNARMDDQFLLTFLRGCKFSLERTKEKLDAYYTYRTAMPEFFSNRDPMLPELQEIFDAGILISLGNDSKGRVCLLYRVSPVDLERFQLCDMMKSYFMLLDVLTLKYEETTIYGINVLIDTEGVTLAFCALWTPQLLKKIFAIYQDAYPCRPQGWNHINTPSIIETILNIVRSLLKEEIKNRFQIHRDAQSLMELGWKSVLPKEYGGDNDTLDVIIKSNKKIIEKYRDYFLEDDKYGVDEMKRPGKPKTEEELFGVQGSFRKLNVD